MIKYVILFILLVPRPAYAFLFGAKLKNEISSMKDSQKKEFSDIKAELGVIKGNQVKLQADIKASVKSEIQAGYDRSVRARDINTTNDTGLMKYMIYAFIGMFGSLAAITMKLIDTKKHLNNVIKSKAKLKEELNGQSKSR